MRRGRVGCGAAVRGSEWRRRRCEAGWLASICIYPHVQHGVGVCDGRALSPRTACRLLALTAAPVAALALPWNEGQMPWAAAPPFRLPFRLPAPALLRRYGGDLSSAINHACSARLLAAALSTVRPGFARGASLEPCSALATRSTYDLALPSSRILARIAIEVDGSPPHSLFLLHGRGRTNSTGPRCTSSVASFLAAAGG